MKNTFTVFKTVAAMLMTLLFHVAQSQTFQNTYHPASADNYVAGAAVNSEYYVIGNTAGYPTAANTVERILFSRYTAGGASSLDRIIYDGANTSHIYNSRDIQMGYSKYTASPSTSLPPPPCTFNGCPDVAPSAVDISDPNSRKYVYITGFYQESPTAVKRLLIIKTDRSANISWARTNLTPPNPDVAEEGVSVESCPNRDVMVVSMTTELATGLKYPTISRLDSAGTLKWRYHYKPGIGETPYNFVPRQSCIFREGTATGDPIGIVVVGEIETTNAPGTRVAVMRVKFNGEMIWKYDYILLPPAPEYQSGWDIMTESNSIAPDAAVAENFVLTGMANPSSSGAGVGTIGIVMRVTTASGFFVNGYFYSAGTTASSIYGQSIYQALTPKSNVVIAGGVHNDAAGVILDTYLMKFNPATGAIAWARNYPLTLPNFPRTESVVSVPTSYPTDGYFISTNAFDTYAGGTALDAHVIKTDFLGNVNAAACLSDTLIVTDVPISGQFQQRCTYHECDTLILKVLTRVTITPPHTLCFSAVRLSGHEELSELVLSVFPNPATDNISVVIVSETSADAVIQMIGLNGQVVMEEKVYLQEGKNEFPLEVKQHPAGVYSIRLISNEVVAVMKIVKME